MKILIVLIILQTRKTKNCRIVKYFADKNDKVYNRVLSSI